MHGERKFSEARLDKSSGTIGGAEYTLTIDPDGLKLIEKGKRKGIALAWRDIISGDAGLALALQASVQG
ncbi:hypothetical protein [Luteibacter sp. 9135]|uniref:hypothetical protein n=1 Tax=Luteibacter sp. 9135 TaxID=1500893 RepID=UPI00055AE7B8|nr:hypothetical protein [Luteibacter sp. 9135]